MTIRIQNIKAIVIAELKVGFLLPDLTLVQSEMVVLGVLGYSRTQHAEWYDEGVLSVSGHCHLGELYYEFYEIKLFRFRPILWVTEKLLIIPPTLPKCHEIFSIKDLSYNPTL